MAGHDPLLLLSATILLPTRRAQRALRDAFLRASAAAGGAETAMLLPRMRPVGDLDPDELNLDDAAAAEMPAVPPAIPALRRRLLLTRLVLGWGERTGRNQLLPGQAAALAASLAQFLDGVATEGADFNRIGDLVPAELAEHWQIVCRFLEILPQNWPRILAAEGALDPAERRNRLLQHQAALWRSSPPRGPVIAAGLIGGIPALTDLLSVVAGLDQGAVILPGLQRGCSEADWLAIEDDASHPQHLMALLLKALGVAPVAVGDWPPPSSRDRSEEYAGLPLFARLRSAGAQCAARMGLVGEAMRPPATTEAWRRLTPQPGDSVARMSRFDCASAQQEALTIALLLRRKLETPGATAALVTPDRELARRVAAELQRWGIAIDDSAGIPLSRTPPGAFLGLILDVGESRFAPVPLLAALKHPLASGGLSPEEFRRLARRLDLALRGPRPGPGFAGFKGALSADPRLQRFAARLEACLGGLPDQLAADNTPLARLAVSHIEAAERLAATATESGGELLWREAAGEAAARFCHELIDAARDFPPLPGRHYPALFRALAADVVVRPAFGRHPRLSIWGLLEARLQQADLLVLGGLNEGSWPGHTAHDPWMSRQMRRAFGISVPERSVGIAAHDFVQALGAPEVALTRAARQEGVPTVPSRWLLRLDAVLRAVGLDRALQPDEALLDAVDLIDEAAYRPFPPAEPRPPLAARPRRLSVTQIETWLRDPYAIYARHILRLSTLEELDADPGYADLGIAIHSTLDEFVRCFPKAMPVDAEEELLRIGRAKFEPLLARPGAWAFWWPRFNRIARWLVAEERARRPTILESLSERRGSLTLPAPGGPFTLTARADRIDRLAAGGVLLVDYKTGSLPSKKEMEGGFAPQLPLEGAIIRDGSFDGLSGTPVLLEYWQLNGADPPGRRCPLGGDEPDRLIDRVMRRVEALIERFDNPETPYLAVPARQWAPRFSEYRHLERIAVSGDEE
jgi:ATP-dependent helicase/nuclease subunit B